MSQRFIVRIHPKLLYLSLLVLITLIITPVLLLQLVLYNMAQQYHQGSWKINNLYTVLYFSHSITKIMQSHNHQLSQDKRTAWATRMSYGKATELVTSLSQL